MGVGNKLTAGGDNSNVEEAPVASPCVAICALDGADICTGCHRSGDEIRQWVSLDNAQRRAVLKEAHARGKVGNPFA